jgi:hypothetical protein
VSVDPHQRPGLQKVQRMSRPAVQRKRFMRWRGSHYRETADRRNRFIAPIRDGRLD